MNEYNVRDSIWYTLNDGTTIGIVTIDNGFEFKKYIGRGTGVDRVIDEQIIAAHGVPFYGSGIIPEGAKKKCK